MMTAKRTKKTASQVHYLRFLLPSCCGIIAFLIPFSYKGKYKILVAHLAESIVKMLKEEMPYFITFLLLGVAALTALATFWNPRWLMRYTWLTNLCKTSSWWGCFRITSGVLGVLVLYKAGYMAHKNVYTVLFELLPTLFVNLLIASLLAPLLLEFGLLEFIGELMAPIMRPLFKLPGQAAINCATSWIGDGTVGTVMTLKQYEKGMYTAKEASIVITSFAAVSITFYAAILKQLDLESYFVPFCFTTLSSSLIAAWIMCRIVPLSRKPSVYLNKITPDAIVETKRGPQSIWKRGWNAALGRAARGDAPLLMFKKALYNMGEIVVNILPSVMFIGTLSMLIKEYTHLFSWLGKPFVPLLQVMQIPHAAQASETLFVGFADMFIPTMIASHICSPLTRFIIGALSVTQIVYLSELGSLLLGSRTLLLNLKELACIFLLRTLITLPIIVCCAYLFLY